MDFAFPSHTSRFCKDLTYAYWRFGPYLSYWKKDGIHIQRSRRAYGAVQGAAPVEADVAA